MSKNVKRRKKRKKKRYPILEIGIFLVLILMVGILFLVQRSNKAREEALEASRIQAEAEKEEKEKEEKTVDLSELYSTSAILIDLDTGEVLAKRNPSQIIYPASLTKMMTVLVALENIEDISASVTLSPDQSGYLPSII